MSALIAAAVLAMAKPIQADKAQIESPDQIRVLPVPRTPESSTIVLTISVPKNGDLKADNPVWVQFRLDGYALGAGSQFDRADEVPVSRMGQTVHVIVDDLPYIAINQPPIDPFNEEGFYYDTSYKFELPYSLEEGMHTIRMFPARSYGESLKGENAFHSIYFYLGDRKDQPGMDLDQPFITYNEPSDQLPLSENRPLLLDFYIKNCELTPDGYKIRLTLDGKIKRTLTSWQPYYLYGLKRGKHAIRLELIDGSGNWVPCQFNDVQRTIQIQ